MVILRSCNLVRDLILRPYPVASFNFKQPMFGGGYIENHGDMHAEALRNKRSIYETNHRLKIHTHEHQR